MDEQTMDYNLIRSVEWEEDLFFEVSGKEYVNEEAALALLLAEEVLHCNNFDYTYRKDGKIAGNTIVLFVNCGDVFAWGFSDSEDFKMSDIGPLLKMHLDDNRWGATQWCCIHRDEQPQSGVVEKMKETGVWDDVMEALPRNKWEDHFDIRNMHPPLFETSSAFYFYSISDAEPYRKMAFRNGMTKACWPEMVNEMGCLMYIVRKI